MRISGHVMLSQSFGSASRRNLEFIGAPSVVRVICITIARSLNLWARGKVRALAAVHEVGPLATAFDHFTANEQVIDAILGCRIVDGDFPRDRAVVRALGTEEQTP